jgi:RecJ-like exonuclease
MAKGNPLRLAAISRRDNALKRAKKRGYVALNATVDEIQEALKTDRCECCGKELEELKDRFVDHCHISGDLRGVLCQACNLIEGLAVDAAHLLKVTEYMNKVRKP